MLIEASILRRLAEQAAASSDEVCGVLLGRGEPPSVELLIDGRNLDPAPHERYLLDAATLLRADALARSSGLVIAGFFHSHPRGPSVPSLADRHAMWPGSVYLIAAVSGTTPYVSAWIRGACGLVAEPIIVSAK